MKNSGLEGEKEVVALVKCPYCGSKLQLMPRNQPLIDVKCTKCVFTAQIKTVKKINKEILGGGYDIIDKTTKAGYLIPPLIINIKSENNKEIRFYPFITKKNLKKRILSKEAKRANYKMFNYIDLDKLPYIIIYPCEKSVNLRVPSIC
ncbi:MAG: hypothetical protein JRN37_00535 [Nitrososphaerota archaeon]|jgi:hypothetical protein|nr:DpnI domain-containing protein [Nitrososphaerota archaeon]MDG7036920.1 hypothetical protein [Nitrososphaerota archaeon]MDG7037638.1 hypothetical protein [Nitrososphaerota archaeon]